VVTTFASTAAPTAAIIPFDLAMAALAVLGAFITGPRTKAAA
jgi:hypothetical protein